MAGVPVALRDSVLTAFRQQVCARLDFVPFLHQATWWAAADGELVDDQIPLKGESSLTVLIRDDLTIPGEPIVDTRIVNDVPCAVVRRRTRPRPGGRARVIADLGSFKIGKSKSSAIWATGFAAIPGSRVKLIGLEYDTCAPEFEYLVEALLSERGMNLKASSLQNRPRDGRMWLDLPNGARYEARSWERKDSLKGKEDDAYVMCEAYQLPGLECYTDFKQNLAVRQGYAVFPTTPDRPWVQVFHEHGHGDPRFPEWQCVCGVKRSVNPYTFDQKAMDQDRHVMTKEKHAIAYDGQLGEFVGSVFGYQRGQRQFTTRTHPHVWANPDGPATFENFRPPAHWEVIGAGDTGTFTSGVLAAFNERGELFVFYEQPNYRYVAGKHEWLDDVAVSSIPAWATTIRTQMGRFGVRGLWADKNSQFKRELQNYDLTLFGADVALETRTDILREYFQHDRIWFAPWLSVVPYEIEQAQWPEETTAAGKFGRIKKQDHTLDGLEHIVARRPHRDRKSVV